MWFKKKCLKWDTRETITGMLGEKIKIGAKTCITVARSSCHRTNYKRYETLCSLLYGFGHSNCAQCGDTGAHYCTGKKRLLQ
jgi:hypothetical protein